MDHRQEDGSFHSKREVAIREELLQDSLTAGLPPQALEEQAWTKGTAGEHGHAALGLGGQDQQGLGEACPRDEESLELAAGLELVETSERGEDALTGAAVFPAVLDHLQVGAGSRLLGAEEHGNLGFSDTMKIACHFGNTRAEPI